MNEEILPACDRLRREKDQYWKWQAAKANSDKLRQFCVAYKYYMADRCVARVSFMLSLRLHLASVPLPEPFPSAYTKRVLQSCYGCGPNHSEAWTHDKGHDALCMVASYWKIRLASVLVYGH
jgi:hypothetical protein